MLITQQEALKSQIESSFQVTEVQLFTSLNAICESIRSDSALGKKSLTLLGHLDPKITRALGLLGFAVLNSYDDKHRPQTVVKWTT